MNESELLIIMQTMKSFETSVTSAGKRFPIMRPCAYVARNFILTRAYKYIYGTYKYGQDRRRTGGDARMKCKICGGRVMEVQRQSKWELHCINCGFLLDRDNKNKGRCRE